MGRYVRRLCGCTDSNLNASVHRPSCDGIEQATSTRRSLVHPLYLPIRCEPRTSLRISRVPLHSPQSDPVLVWPYGHIRSDRRMPEHGIHHSRTQTHVSLVSHRSLLALLTPSVAPRSEYTHMLTFNLYPHARWLSVALLSRIPLMCADFMMVGITWFSLRSAGSLRATATGWNAPWFAHVLLRDAVRIMRVVTLFSYLRNARHHIFLVSAPSSLALRR